MKKILLFLLLFSGGLALLFYLQGEQDPKENPVKPPTVEDQTEDQGGPEITIPMVDEEDPGNQRQLSMQFSGPYGFIGDGDPDPVTGVLPRLYKFTTSNWRPVEDDLALADDVVLLLYDPATDTVRAEIRANRGYLHLDLDSQGGFAISSSKPVRLEGVDLTILRGAPITPMHFRAPALDWLRVDGSFSSADRIVLESPGISAVGTGMRIVTSEGRESITLLRDAEMTFELDDGTTAKLESLGLSPLVLSRALDAGLDRIRLTVDDGARLSLPGGRVLNSQSLTVIGERQLKTDLAGNETGQFQLTSVEALGQVSMTGEEGTLYGSEATMEFDAQGQPESMVVSGSPRAELGILTSPTTIANASIEGVGPLTIQLGTKGRFELKGPAVMNWPKERLVVSAKDWVRGSYEEATEQATIHAQGAVKVTHPEGELEGPSLEITYEQLAMGVELAHLKVEGPSVLKAQDELGRVLVVEAKGELLAHTRREEGDPKSKFILERADDVTVNVKTPVAKEKDFTATCGVLRDIDLGARTLVAENGVTYQVEGLFGKGDRVLMNSETDFEVFGTAANPATLTLEGGTGKLGSVDSVVLEASYLHATPMRIETAEAVEIVLKSGARTLNASAADLLFEWLAEESSDKAPRPYRMTATNLERAGLREAGDELLLSCAKLVVEGEFGEEIGPFEMDATGKVRIEASGKERELSDRIGGTSKLVGLGERFTWVVTAEDLAGEDAGLGAGRGRLSTDEGKRVRSLGNLAGERLPYEMSADWVEFDRENFRAKAPHLRIDSTNLPTSQGPGSVDGSQVFDVTAKSLVATRNVIRLEDTVHLIGESVGNYSWSLDSDEVEIRLDLDASTEPVEGESFTPSVIESVVAQGNLAVNFNGEMQGTGKRMVAVDDTLRLEGRPARLEVADYAWESGWIEISLRDEIVTTGPGQIVPRGEDLESAWKIRYESLQPFQEGEVTVLALRNVLLSRGDRLLRANWALFWIDNEERAKVNHPLMGGSSGLRADKVDREAKPSVEPGEGDPMAPLQGIWDSSLARVLNELYVEGDVEFLVGGDRLVRSDAIYVDLVERHSWIQGADIRFKTPETRGESVRVKAEWIRHTEDGTLRAEKATLTSCSHDVPHYVIEVSNLKMDPILEEDNDNTYLISFDENSLRFKNGARLPLPSTSIERDEEGGLDLSSLSVFGLKLPDVTIGNSSKFGTTVGAQAGTSFGRIGKLISGTSERLLNLERDSVRGNWKYGATWFGSRGLMLGVGFKVSDGDRFNLDVQADGLPDGDRDRGLVRVPEDDRSTFRGWYRARGRYYIKDDEWVDLRFTYQTDAGVQAEFFERDFVGFEERETYLHWRKADDQFFYAATIEATPSSGFTEIQEVPTIKAFRGRTPLGTIGDVPVLYSANADLEYLKRHDGDQEAPFADGLGDQTVARFDTTHRFETPLNIGESAVRLTPFIEGRGTAWNESQTGFDDPLRAALTGGGELSMALWKRSSGGRIHTIAPKVGTRITMGVDESGGKPIFFDEVENPIEGHYVDLGVRSTWRGPDPNRYVDLDLTAVHATDVASDVDGWAVGTYALLRSYLSGMPVAFLHDSRYDLDDSRTDYSRTAAGIKPWDRLELGTGYNSGRGRLDERLYETASVSARFRATPKWDLEFRQIFSLDGDEDLESRFLIRRFGHDMLFELELRDRAGEGTGFSIGVRPRIGWKRPTLGLFRN